jgi:monofunctional biosynthetic peptidoglycan transglycosylase
MPTKQTTAGRSKPSKPARRPKQTAQRHPLLRRPRRSRAGGMIRRGVLVALALSVLLPVGLILPLAWLNPPTTTFMLNRRFADPPCPAIQFEWVDALRLPRHVSWAAVAAEDQRFHQHWGFDLASIRDAFVERQASGRVRGASTITQQVTKNLFLWPGRSWLRKGLEAYLTVWMELLLSKGRILELYVNIAQLGPCTFGAGAASQASFGKEASELTPRDAARLAAVLPSPETRRAEPASPYVRRRGEQILAQMENLYGPFPLP